MGEPVRKFENQNNRTAPVTVMCENAPGYPAIFFGTWMFATALCVSAAYWPIITGIVSVLVMIGSAGNAFKGGQIWRVRVQFAMISFSGLLGVIVAFSAGSTIG